MSRTIKQIIYGFFYLVIIAGIVYGGYIIFRETAPTCNDNRQNQQETEVDCGGPNCVSCVIRHLQPIAPKLEYFGVGNNTSVILTLSNPNLDYGADALTYTLNFYDVGRKLIFSVMKDSFIYPAEAQKIIVEPNLKFNYLQIAGQPEIVISNVSWKSLVEFPMPKVQTRQIQTSIVGSQVTVSGILVNRESVSLPKATIGLLVYQQMPEANRLVGASKTVLQGLRPFEERAFKIFVPLDSAYKLPEIDTLITTEVQR
ncbi:MAG: hypothetical protein Q8L24_02395 [bacterium]|nr:hypothetical protein [bacterium]